MSDWMSQGAGGLYGTLTTYGGGGNLHGSTRDALDYARQGSPGRTPEAEYPDGYLNGVGAQGQRQDKLAVSNLNARPYGRGVHKGERINPGDYIWPEDQRADRGIRNQRRGKRTGLGDGAEGLLQHGPNNVPNSVPMVPDGQHISKLSGFRPPWS